MAHQLFTIQHLLHEICSYTPRSELLILARVSSSWFQCAASHLYKNLDIREAFAPLEKTVKMVEKMKFVKAPSDKDFKRLVKYTPYVRTLRMRPEFVFITFEVMCRNVFSGIPYLFPNIRDLNWENPEYSQECMEVALGLISPKIDRLSFFIDDDRMLRYLCLLIMSRLPALHSVTIGDETQAGTAGDSTEPSCLIKPVKDLFTFFAHTLTFVDISLSLNTPSIVKCLSRMPKLCQLTVGDMNTGYSIMESEKRNICGSSFPSLHSVLFEGSPQIFHDMFLKPYILTSLTTLELYSELSPSDIHISISSIIVACPHLESLELGRWQEDVDTLTYAWPVVPWSSIQPISSCKKLTGLSLYWMRVAISLEELTEFLDSRMTWKHFRMFTADPLRLEDMLIYSRHCPNLEHLSFYLRGNGDELCAGNLPGLSDIPLFSTLKYIDFAGSIFTESTSLALAQFLCRICKKPPCDIFGLDKKTVDDVLRNLASSYINEQCRTGSPMSSEIRDFVNMMLRTRIPAEQDDT